MSLGTSGIVNTGYAQFWGSGSNAYQPLFGRNAPEMDLSRVLARGGNRAFRRVLTTLNGSAVGSTATETRARISAPAGLTQNAQLGGSRAIDTITEINRVTATADMNYVAAVATRMFVQQPSSYAVDASGNGGGGKAGR